MPQFTTRRRVRHSAADMFDLVADVESYPAFVPLCKALNVRERTPSGDGIETIVADMTVSFKLVRESFRSRVTLDRPRLQILVEYLQGPFSHMQNRWVFRPAGDMFDVAFRRFAAAFEARANQVYGRRKTA
jgi:coenzyme Q-binding protein COQ10